MAKQRKPREPDANTIAKRMIDELIARTEGRELPKPPEPKPKNPAAVELGRLGGLKGGKARAMGLSGERRSEISQKAAKARWSKKP